MVSCSTASSSSDSHTYVSVNVHSLSDGCSFFGLALGSTSGTAAAGLVRTCWDFGVGFASAIFVSGAASVFGFFPDRSAFFLAGSPLLSFFSGRFVFGLSTSSSKVFLLLKLPLSLLQLFWSWIHQRHVPADMIHPLTSLSRWSYGLWFLRFRCRWWSFRLWFGLLQPFRYSWWSLSSGSQCHWARDSSPCPRFGLRLCYN